MTNHDTTPDFETSRLISRHIAGTITPEESGRLDAWLADDANRALFDRMTSEEVMAEKIARYGRENPAAAFEQFVARRSRAARRTRRIRRMVAAAVIVPLLAAAGVLLLRLGGDGQPAEQEWVAERGLPVLTLSTGQQVTLGGADSVVVEQDGTVIPVSEGGGINYLTASVGGDNTIYNLLEIPAAGDYHFVLSDGTRVWMNAMSSLRYPVVFDPQERVLEASGEIYLEVEPDPRRPFYVVTGDMRIEVTGTEFNVLNYAGDGYSEVTLVGGRVKVHVAGERYDLTPGRQLHWAHGSAQAEVRQVNIADHISWKDGMYVFKSRLLDEVMKVARRWYDIEVVFETPAAARSVYTGVMMKEDSLGEFLARLEQTSPYAFGLDGRTVTVR